MHSELTAGIFETGMTVTQFPQSTTQFRDIYRFLDEIYEEFRRQKLYNSTLLLYLQRLRNENEYDYTDDAADEHLFETGPLPGDYTFLEFGRSIKAGNARRGYQLWLVDVCEGQNIWNNWRIVLEIV